MSKNKVYLSLADKWKIVGKAYAQPIQIKATARQYHMQPAQICHWRATIPSAGLEDNGAVVGTSKKSKTLHKGKEGHYKKRLPSAQDVVGSSPLKIYDLHVNL